jgi:hypothetical protein
MPIRMAPFAQQDGRINHYFSELGVAVDQSRQLRLASPGFILTGPEIDEAPRGPGGKMVMPPEDATLPYTRQPWDNCLCNSHSRRACKCDDGASHGQLPERTEQDKSNQQPKDDHREAELYGSNLSRLLQ